MSIKTNRRHELVEGENYTIVRVTSDKKHYETEEICYIKGKRILKGDYTFYLSGHSLDIVPFINNCVKSNFEIIHEANFIKSIFSFIHNIPAGIIDLTWPKDQYGWLNNHLKAKYEGFCIKEGYASPNAILKFAYNLDSTNLSIFCEKIIELIQTSKF